MESVWSLAPYLAERISFLQLIERETEHAKKQEAGYDRSKDEFSL